MAKRLVLGLAALVACGDGSVVDPDTDAATPTDAADIADASPLPDRIDPLLWVDFSATGCTSGGIDDTPCVGPAPLEVRFTASAPAAIDAYLWSFGDGAPTDGIASPVHRFERPGSYDIALTVGGPGGTASQTRSAWVVVEPATLGATCDLNAQCESGLECVCRDGTDCAAGLTDGLCSNDCNEVSPCPATGVCANLAPVVPPMTEDWMRTLCLSACEDDSQCRTGFRCRELLSGTDATWVEGCFPDGLLADIGRSCALPDASLDDALCASGLCAAEGARGMCTADCSADPCPSYAACASFTDGAIGSLCVARCSDSFECDEDPWLECTAPGGPGDKGFTVDEAPAASGYCAPKACATPSDCGPDGDCVGGYCAPS